MVACIHDSKTTIIMPDFGRHKCNVVKMNKKQTILLYAERDGAGFAQAPKILFPAG
jgi:hypothetical protein